MRFTLVLCAGLAVLAFHSAARAEGEDVVSAWQSFHDFEEARAFEIVGPPMKDGLKNAEDETALYLDMILYYEDIAEDDDDFSFVAEAFSVSLEELRPATLRIAEEDVDDVFSDDPLPGRLNSSSFYVDRIRVPALPGRALKPRILDDVKLGDAEKRSLFLEPEKPKPAVAETPEPEKKPEPPKKVAAPEPLLPPSLGGRGQRLEPAEAEKQTADAPAPKPDLAAGKINAPRPAARPYVNPDEETLVLLRQAVKELGLEKQLNFESSPFGSQTLVQVNEQKDGKPKMDMPPAASATAPATSPAVAQTVAPQINTPSTAAPAVQVPSLPSPALSAPPAPNAAPAQSGPLPSTATVAPSAPPPEAAPASTPETPVKPKPKRKRKPPPPPPPEKVEEEDSGFF